MKYLISENLLICQESARIVTFLILCHDDVKFTSAATIIDWIFNALDLSNTDTNIVIPIMVLQNILIKHNYRLLFISNNIYWMRYIILNFF